MTNNENLMTKEFLSTKSEELRGQLVAAPKNRARSYTWPFLRLVEPRSEADSRSRLEGSEDRPTTALFVSLGIA